jgi:hypothetical protein
MLCETPDDASCRRLRRDRRSAGKDHRASGPDYTQSPPRDPNSAQRIPSRNQCASPRAEHLSVRPLHVAKRENCPGICQCLGTSFGHLQVLSASELLASALLRVSRAKPMPNAMNIGVSISYHSCPWLVLRGYSAGVDFHPYVRT